MRSYNLSWRNARRHKFAWQGSYGVYLSVWIEGPVRRATSSVKHANLSRPIYRGGVTGFAVSIKTGLIYIPKNWINLSNAPSLSIVPVIHTRFFSSLDKKRLSNLCHNNLKLITFEPIQDKRELSYMQTVKAQASLRICSQRVFRQRAVESAE